MWKVKKRQSVTAFVRGAKPSKCANYTKTKKKRRSFMRNNNSDVLEATAAVVDGGNGKTMVDEGFMPDYFSNNSLSIFWFFYIF